MTRIVRITVRTTGVNFGYRGVVKARNGREIATTDVYPFEASAQRAAEDLVEARGWEVA